MRSSEDPKSSWRTQRNLTTVARSSGALRHPADLYQPTATSMVAMAATAMAYRERRKWMVQPCWVSDLLRRNLDAAERRCWCRCQVLRPRPVHRQREDRTRYPTLHLIRGAAAGRLILVHPCMKTAVARRFPPSLRSWRRQREWCLCLRWRCDQKSLGSTTGTQLRVSLFRDELMPPGGRLVLPVVHREQ